MDFNGSGLLQTLKTTRSNADTISEKGGVTKILGLDSTFAVISLTNAAQPHIVNNDSGRIRCDCDGYGRRSVPMGLLWHVPKIFCKTLFLSGFQIIQA